MKWRLLDFLYPAICELCRKRLDHGRALCRSCANNLPRISEPFCKNCGEEFDGNLEEDFNCQNCLNLTHDFKFARAPLRGLENSFRLVHTLKYHRRFFVAADLAAFLQEAWEEDPRFREFEENCLIIPVPLYWRRQQWRHGNQAHELARELAALIEQPLSPALKRVRSTQTQTRLSRKERLSNLRGAFVIRKSQAKRLRGANVILIDDVFTTGATAHECTRILRHQGRVAKVAILTLVRG